MKALANDVDGVATRLAAGPYAEPALVPAIRPPQGALPGPPAVESAPGGISLAPAGPQRPWLWVVRSRTGDDWRTAILPGATKRHDLPATAAEVSVAAVARDGRDGAATRLSLGAGN